MTASIDLPADPDDAPLSEPLRKRFAAIVGPRNVLTDPAAMAPHLTETRGLFQGKAAMVLKPGSVEEVAAIAKLANETLTPLVPQGGNTGHVGGQSPRSPGQVLLSLNRLDTIRAIDPAGRTITVDAGVVLQRVQEAAEAADLFFPLSLGSEGSCQIGGNLASNAGGTGVLAYGNARELCLGIEAVLASGAVYRGLRRLKKDNRGYDLRDLLIGSEGTLGIITGAVLKLFPRPAGREVAYAGVADPTAALALLRIAERHAGAGLTGFEIMPRLALDFVLNHIDGARDPMTAPHPWYVLVEVSSSRSGEDARQTMETLLTEAFSAATVADAAIAQSLSEAKAFWHMRESMSFAQKPEGGSIKHDVAVPVAKVPEFLDQADRAVLAAIPGARICSFGHLGDGNIHYNISQPLGADKDSFLSRWREVNAIVHGIVAALDGTFSAEHGIGLLKRDELARTKPPVEMNLMRDIKRAFDPNNILNPGKLIQI
ncbi:FAD-binding oxidoreductase [Jiella sp. MQZ9-1]|uniref:FAD-binding oxidoreductase n=1 Tax=Jiella flava TaxID=2816857 RepID=A0A939FY61_9HYPH|nr:FAD-binding oxidoreductase [Jiella flava]MBO0664163.1 FAD-binding oxidoreductase [Jiella flava]MCD2472735.1 FAD-binding oxidoreductase [Jiella flava]